MGIATIVTQLTVGLIETNALAATPLVVVQMSEALDGSGGLVGNGWFAADGEGSRWTGAEAEARLTVPAAKGMRMIYLSVEAGPVATTFLLWADSQVLDRIPLAAHQPVSLFLPLPDSMAGKVVQFRLVTSPTWTPAAFGSPDDHRVLGVRVRGLGTSAGPVPTAARIDGTAEGVNGLIGRGWFEADAEGTRWTGADAEARLTIPAGRAHLLCVSATAGPVPTTFQVSVNDRLIKQIKLNANQPAALRLPLAPKPTGAVIRVHLGAAPTWIPADFGYVGDRRALGVRMKALAVVEGPSGSCPAPVEAVKAH